jgi:hypothetical protein
LKDERARIHRSAFRRVHIAIHCYRYRRDGNWTTQSVAKANRDRDGDFLPNDRDHRNNRLDFVWQFVTM